MDQSREQPTLPPNVIGGRIGTLAIRFQQCSVPNSFARIKFWGDDRFYDVHPNNALRYHLVGTSIETVAKYLTDASPLHIQIISTNSTSLVGNVFITDMSLPRPDESADLTRSSRSVISLRQKIVGDCSFELQFRMLPIQQQHMQADIMGAPSNHVDIPDLNVNEMIEQQSDTELGSVIAQHEEEKYSLLSELLDICSDDMTIPTVDTSLVAATGVDPYELWISNMVSGAASPPQTSSQSLLHVESFEVSINELFLLNDVVKEMDGKQDLCIEYNLPLCDESNRVVSFTVCRELGKLQTKMKRGPPKIAGRKSKPDGKPLLSQLLKHQHTEKVAITTEFEDDEAVRCWMNNVITFELYSCTTNPRSATTTPKSKKLVGQSNVRLQDIILSESLIISKQIDIMDCKKEKNIGKLSLQMRLLKRDKVDDKPVRKVSSETATTRVQQKDTISSESFPHPISLFLNNIANSKSQQTQVHSSTRPESDDQVNHPRNNEAPKKLEPVEPPPVWIDFGVKSISNLRIKQRDGNSTANRLELKLECSEQLLSLSDLVQSTRDDNTTSSSQVENIKSVEMMNDSCGNVVSITKQLSWKAGLKTMNGVEIVITLQIRYCSNTTKELVGIVSIPFVCTRNVETRHLLPRFDVHGWFDIADPITGTSVGKIHLWLATGILRQINLLEKATACALTIQRYWRKTKKRTRYKPPSLRTSDPQPSLDSKETSEPKQIQIQTQTVFEQKDEDERHMDNQSPSEDSKEDIAASSPDSLFEEWSQQSYLKADTHEKDVVNETAAIVKEGMSSLNTEAFVPAESALDVAESHASSSPSNQLDTTISEMIDEPNTRLREPIDPPEENVLSTKPCNETKRKLEHNDLDSDSKRQRVADDAATCKTDASHVPLPSFQAAATQTVDHESSDDDKDVAVATQTLNHESSEDEDDVMSYRSLQSVMKSLAGVEARLKDKSPSHSHPPTSVLLESQKEKSQHAASDDSSSKLSPHSIEPLKSSSLPLETPQKDSQHIETSEKGTSPLFVTSRYKDAATSPCTETEEIMETVAECVSNVKEDTREDEPRETVRTTELVDPSHPASSSEPKTGQDKENEVDASKHDNDGMKVQLDWSLRKLSGNHHASTTQEGMFTTMMRTSSSGRRERYGNLFANTQSCPPRGTMRPSILFDGQKVVDGSRSYSQYLTGGRRLPTKPTSPIRGAASVNFTTNSVERLERILSSGKKPKNE
jgi:hypothetical protein